MSHASTPLSPTVSDDAEQARALRQLSRTFWVLFWLLLLGGLLVFLFLPAQSRLFSTLLIAGCAAGLVGTLVGFLFGIPRILQPGASATSPPVTGGPSNHEGAAPASSEGTSSPALSYRFNTNLEEISDWLTKIFVGVSLVQLHQAGEALEALATRLTPGGTPPGTGAFVGAVLVFFLVLGFLFGYLWTRLIYTGMQARIDRDVLGQLARRMLAVAAHGIGRLPGSMGARGGDKTLVEPLSASDPHKGAFGGLAEANGRRLRATVSPSPMDADVFAVSLSVVSTDQTKPLRGLVEFHLHPTFREPVVPVRATGTEAKLEVYAWGAFTVGVVADGGDTRLELDLSELADAPPRFRSR